MSRLWSKTSKLVKIPQEVGAACIMDIIVFESLKEGKAIYKK